MITRQERLERLDSAIAEGRIIHSKWRRVEGGREYVCLLAALSPEVADAEDAEDCPADVMPLWLALLTPDLDDYVSHEYRPTLIRRYAGLAHRWHVLDADAWQRCDWAARRVALVEARSHTDYEPSVEVCDLVIALLDRALAGDEPSAQEWADAMTVARTVAMTVASTVAETAAATAAAASWAATATAAAATAAAEKAAAASWAAGPAAATAAWDRIAEAILDAIEVEIEMAEGDG